MKRWFVMMGMLLLAACGGGGGGTSGSGPVDPGAGSGDVTITGKVAGTDVVAVDAATGSVAARQTATVSGSDKVFSIKVSSGKKYKFYLVEGVGTSIERIYPLYIGTNNQFNLSAGTCDLGFISTADGNARPANTPSQFAGAGEDKSIPTGIMKKDASIYKTRDLEGKWYFLNYATGVNPYWLRTTANINSAGSVTFSDSYDNTGQPATTDPSTLSITSSGAINFSGADNALMQMSQSKNLIIGTMNMGKTSAPTLVVGIKAGAKYSVADLAGVWKRHTLVSGTAPMWQRGVTTINASGNVTSSTQIDSNGISEPDGTTQVPINQDGTITVGAVYGAMTSDKNLAVVLTANGNEVPAIQILTKTGGTNFGKSDQYGSWKCFDLITSYTSGNDNINIWARYAGVGDASGRWTIGRTTSSGDTYANIYSAGLVTVSSGGIITTDDASYEGIISLNKDIAVYTATDTENSKKSIQLGVLLK